MKLSPGTREVWADGKPIELTTIEFDILDLIVRSAGPGRLAPRADSRDPPAAGLAAGSLARRARQPHPQETGRARGADPNRARSRLPVPGRAARDQRDPLMKIRVQVDLHQDRGLGRRHGGRSRWLGSS